MSPYVSNLTSTPATSSAYACIIPLSLVGTIPTVCTNAFGTFPRSKRICIAERSVQGTSTMLPQVRLKWPLWTRGVCFPKPYYFSNTSPTPSSLPAPWPTPSYPLLPPKVNKNAHRLPIWHFHQTTHMVSLSWPKSGLKEGRRGGGEEGQRQVRRSSQ
jgi:hypothetical protein